MLPRLVVPQEKHLRWSLEFEADMSARVVEQAIQAAVGCLSYQLKTWEDIAAALDAKPEAAISALETAVPQKEQKKDRGDVSEFRLLVLQGDSGSPPKWSQHESYTQFGHFGVGIENRFSSRPSILDVFLNAEDRIAKHLFATESLKTVLRAAEDDARQCGDAYLFEVDRVTTCRERPGELPIWQSSIVLLRIRKSAKDLVVTLSRRSGPADGSVTILCTSLGGNDLATLCQDAHSTFGELRTSLARRLETTEKRLKLVHAGGALIHRWQDGISLATVFAEE